MSYVKQNDLLLKKLMNYYNKDDDSLNKMLSIINGTSRISLRIVDWFATNYAKKNYTVYTIVDKQNNIDMDAITQNGQSILPLVKNLRGNNFGFSKVPVRPENTHFTF